MKFNLIFFVVVGVIVAGNANHLKTPDAVEEYCNVNEVYSACKGCDQYCNSEPVFCTLECKPGCSCRKGYVRSFQGGICIPAQDCPAPVQPPVEEFCNVNEVYSECKGCDQYCNREPVFCTLECKPGCSCRKGYVRSFEGGICIPARDCPAPVQEPEEGFCEVNEVYRECGCCDNYCNREPIVCTADCRKPGCCCKNGFVRSFRGICIPKNRCPGNQNNGPGPFQTRRNRLKCN